MSKKSTRVKKLCFVLFYSQTLFERLLNDEFSQVNRGAVVTEGMINDIAVISQRPVNVVSDCFFSVLAEYGNTLLFSLAEGNVESVLNICESASEDMTLRVIEGRVTSTPELSVTEQTNAKMIFEEGNN